MATLKVSVVIPTFNRKELLKSCLRSVLDQELPPEEILVVDNGSTDGTPEMLESEFFPAVRWVREQQKGVHHARNRGVREARGDILCFIDDDCAALSGWTKALAACFEDPSVAAAGGPTQAVWDFPPPQGLLQARKALSYLGVVDFGPGQRLVGSGREFLIGANLALRKAVVEREGLFRAVFPLPGTGTCAEDVDLFRRIASRHGVVYAPAARVLHHMLSYKTRWRYLVVRVFCIEAANSRLRPPTGPSSPLKADVLLWEASMGLARLLGRAVGRLLPRCS